MKTSPFSKLPDLETCCLSGQLQILDFLTSVSYTGLCDSLKPSGSK